jgi:hypothetical protein
MMAFYEGCFQVTSTAIEQPFTEAQVGFLPGNVFITVENQNVRYRYGDADPTTTAGHLLVATAGAVFSKPREIINLKFISTSGTATIQFTVEGR